MQDKYKKIVPKKLFVYDYHVRRLKSKANILQSAGVKLWSKNREFLSESWKG